MRAEYLDEGIDLIRTLWEGGTKYHGAHFHYECDRSDLSEVVRPARERIPIWVVGVWPRPKSMRRVLRCDGVVPQIEIPGRPGSPDDIREMLAWLAERGRDDLDVVIDGETPSDAGRGRRPRSAMGRRGRDLVARDSLGDAAQQRRADGSRFAIGSGAGRPAPERNDRASYASDMRPSRLERGFLIRFAHRRSLPRDLARDLAERPPAEPDRHPCAAEDDK